MRKIFSCLLLLFTANAFCDVIHLKSGRKISCESVAEDATQVQCKIARSTMSFPKAQVTKIEKSTASAITPPAPTTKSTLPATHNPADEMESLARAHRYTLEGIASMKKQQYSSAIDRFLDAYDAYRNKETISNLAMAYYYAGNYESAQSYFQELLTVHPDDTLALNALGILAAIKGDRSAADNYWRMSYSIKADPVILGYLQKLSQMEVPRPGSITTSLNRSQMEKTIASYQEDSDTHFHIRYDGGSVNPVLLKDISRSLEDNYDKLRFDFEVEPSNTVEVVLYPRKDFLSITGAPDWSGGFNDGRIHLPVGGLDSVNSDVTRVIVHELTHSFFLAKTNGSGPVWLQEGVAQYMDGTRIGASSKNGLSQLFNADRFPSLNQLSGSFMGANDTQATIYYAASLSFVEFLMSHYRFDEMNDLLRKLGAGAALDDAVRQAFGNDLPALEDEWHESIH
jgi:hypothetical protein